MAKYIYVAANDRDYLHYHNILDPVRCLMFSFRNTISTIGCLLKAKFIIWYVNIMRYAIYNYAFLRWATMWHIVTLMNMVMHNLCPLSILFKYICAIFYKHIYRLHLLIWHLLIRNPTLQKDFLKEQIFTSLHLYHFILWRFDLQLKLL